MITVVLKDGDSQPIPEGKKVNYIPSTRHTFIEIVGDSNNVLASFNADEVVWLYEEEVEVDS